MGLPAINSLANMELMLYGGNAGLNSACPSFLNGYRGDSAFYNNMIGMYNNPYNFGFNPTFRGGNSIYDTYTPSYEQQQAGNTNFQGITQEDMNKLADYYANNNALEEGFAGAAAGGLSWMAIEHAQSIFHPINAFFSKETGVSQAEKVFKDIAKNKTFMKENSILVQEGYTAVQQATRDTGKKWFISGWLRRPIGKLHPGDEKEITKLVDNLKKAFEIAEKNPTEANIKAAAEATERLQAARGYDGKLIPGKSRTVAERLADKSKPSSSLLSKLGLKNSSPKADITKNVEGLLARNSGKLGTIVKQMFKKDFLGFMLFETAFNIGKISTAFKKDSTTGLKQTGQSVGKSALGVAGWCLGRAAGTWLGAKAGAAIGTAICPGVGTAVGALIGFTVGSIGMWLGHKLGNKVFGKDVADKVEAKNMTKTEAGQAQLLQFAMQKAQEGKTDAQTNQVLGKLLNAYA